MQYKSIDLFAGIGGVRLGFEQAMDVKTVFASEIDKNANKTYRENFKDDFEITGDITKVSVDDVPSFDICLAGFPCQAFSIAGQKGGFWDNHYGRYRGTLFLDVIRICDKHKPKVIFCENVKGLVMHDKGRTFKVIRSAFKKIGYNVYYKVLNSKNFGVPQNRERIYIVCFRKDLGVTNFRFPKGTPTTRTIKDILEPSPIPAKYYLSETYMNTLIRHKERHKAKGAGFGYIIRGLSEIAGTILCGGMGRERNLIVDARPHPTTPTTHIKGDLNKDNIRKMTPREWARLQGFPDDYKFPLADTHTYKQLGNSVSVPVIKAIAEKIKEALEKAEKKKKEDWHVILFSGGKDSTAMLLRMVETGAKIDEILFCDTGAEFPAMYEHIEKVEKFIGRKITKLKAEHDFEYFLLKYRPKERRNKSVKEYKDGLSWPSARIRWCTRRLKADVVKDWLKEKANTHNIIQYVGIAADEKERIKDKKYPLVEWGWTEENCLRYCYEKGFDWGGLYKLFKRVSCWCCPLQRIDSLRQLRGHFPELWAKLFEWQKETYNSFLPKWTLDRLEEKFAKEDEMEQLKLFDEDG